MKKMLAVVIVCIVMTATVFQAGTAQFWRAPIEDILQASGGAKKVIRSVRAIAPELFMSTMDTIESMGYVVEAHQVTTEDGYRLTMQRIRLRDSKPGPPVVMSHGFLGRGQSFVVGGHGVAPGLTLADHGYDVWLSNSRGTLDSRKHKTLSPRSAAFWKFTFHEIGVYDLAAEIDHVLNVTGYDKLFHIGHSMGPSAFFALASLRPGYNEKVRLHVSVAPAVFLNYNGSFAIDTVLNREIWQRVVTVLLKMLPADELQADGDLFMTVMHIIFNERSHFHKFGPVFSYMLFGQTDLNNTTGFPRKILRAMGSSSGHLIKHYAELAQSDRFQLKDWGKQKNIKLYGSEKPPLYPLEKVTAPVALFASESDTIVTVPSVKRLSKVLPNVVDMKIIRGVLLNHADFLWHKDTKELYLNHLLDLMAKY